MAKRRVTIEEADNGFVVEVYHPAKSRKGEMSMLDHDSQYTKHVAASTAQVTKIVNRSLGKRMLPHREV